MGERKRQVARIGVGLSLWEETGTVVDQVRLKAHGALKRKG